MTVLTGTLLAHGRRTVCRALRFSGEQMHENGSQYHQVLTRARWSPLATSQCVLLLIGEPLVPKGACIQIVSDETLERRWEPHSNKRGHDRESALSRRKRAVSRSERRWRPLLGRPSPGLCLQCRCRHASPHDCDVGRADGECRASMAPRSRHRCGGRWSLHLSGVGSSWSPACHDVDCSLPLGERLARTTSSHGTAHHGGKAPDRGPTHAPARSGVPPSEHRRARA